MKKITFLGYLLFSMVTTAKVTAAETSFEDTTVSGNQSIDTGDAKVPHVLVNNIDESRLHAATMDSLWYTASFNSYKMVSSRLADGDFVGRADFMGNIETYVDEVQAQLLVAARTNSISNRLALDNIILSGEAPAMTPNVNFDVPFVSIDETDTTITFTVSPSEAPLIDGSVEVFLTAFGTAQEGVDFQFSSPQIINFTAGNINPVSFDVTIIDNTIDSSDVFFVLGIQNPDNVIIGDQDICTVYILDDDTVVPVEDTTPLEASLLTSYLVDAEGTSEIVAYDPIQQSLFVTNGAAVEVLDFTNPNNISNLISGDVSTVGDNVQSVAVSNGLVAIAISNFDGTQNGFVVFAPSDMNSTEQPVIVEVGVLPDMVTFTPDGTKLLVANEGEPNDDYSIDPEGSVSIIDVTGGLSEINQFDVVNISFNAFDGMEDTFNAQGIRIYGPGASVSQDLEPEYIAVSDNSETAYVTLQENNAYAVVDIVNETITDVISFGLKDHSLVKNSLDVSDEIDFVFDASWPIMGMYMPDAIDVYTVNGVEYIVTANEGDAREYETFEEEVKIDDDAYVLDPIVFGDTSILELESNLAEINVTNASGDIDGDGDFDEIHVFGGRSFSIFEAATGTLVYDSGNDFEVITANHPEYGAIFNASSSNNNPKNRSDNKGPEPEGILVQEIDGAYYAFILLERIGGIMIYNVTDPVNPIFLQYLNNRGTNPEEDESGDLAPEGLVYIAPEDNALNKGLIVVSNERSATLSIYQLDANVLNVSDVAPVANEFIMQPNPTSGIVYFTMSGTYSIYDVTGRKVLEAPETSSMDVSSLKAGTYIVQNEQGQARKLIIK